MMKSHQVALAESGIELKTSQSTEFAWHLKGDGKVSALVTSVNLTSKECGLMSGGTSK